MHAARPARSVLSRCLRQSAPSSAPTAATAAAVTAATAQCRSFQTTASRPKKRSRFRNIKAEDMGLTNDPKKLEEFATKSFPEYTNAEKEALRAKYTPEQYEALMAAEEAVDSRDLAVQGRLRDDPYKLPYIEDFATVQPIIDAKPKPENPAVPKEHKWLDHKEWVDEYIAKLADRAEDKMKDSIGRAVARALRRVKETNPVEIDFSEEELLEIEKNPELRRKYIIESEAANETYDAAMAEAESGSGAAPSKPASEKWWKDIDEKFWEEFKAEIASEDRNPLEPSKLEAWKELDGDAANSAVAPDLGKVEGVKGLYKPPVDPEDGGLDDAGTFQDIKRLTGLKVADILALPRKILVVRSVHNQTRLGKVRSVSIMVAAGNGNGRLGIGLAKSTDSEVARSTAELLAIRNMKPVRRYENRTIYGEVEAKVSGTVVQLKSRPPGFGLRVSHRIFEMARMAGIHDLSAKIPRSRNPLNTVKAAYEALTNQPDPEQIAIGRGKKMVDVRKVYYGGSVH